MAWRNTRDKLASSEKHKRNVTYVVIGMVFELGAAQGEWTRKEGEEGFKAMVPQERYDSMKQ